MIYEANPDTMMKYGDTLLRAALDETPGGLQGKPYLDALKIRRETIARVTAEIPKAEKDFEKRLDKLLAGFEFLGHLQFLNTLSGNTNRLFYTYYYDIIGVEGGAR